jgi:phosphate/sulfate permease
MRLPLIPREEKSSTVSIRWGVARNIGLAWVISLPASGISAALAYLVLNPILGAAGAA